MKMELALRALADKLAEEQRERNYFQLERDKVNSFWEITKRERDELKAELRNKEREGEEAEEKHQVSSLSSLTSHLTQKSLSRWS